MKNILLIIGSIFFSFRISAQSSVKGFKYFEKAEYDKSIEAFNKHLKEDSTSSVSNFGLAVIYSIDSYENKDYFKAWDYFVKANASFSALTPEENEFFKKYFSERDAHRRNRTNRYNYDFEMKLIEDKLIKYVREENNIAIAEHFIRVYPHSKYYENVVHIRNHIEYRTAEKTNSLEAYHNFITNHPDAAQIPKAIKACNILAFDLAKKTNTINGYNEFMKSFPDADQYFEALKIRDQLAFDLAKKKNTIESLDEFINTYPKALQIMSARAILRKLLYDKAKEVNTLEAYNDFISRYPEGDFFVDIFNLKANVLGKTIAAKFDGNIEAISWIKGFDYDNKKDFAGGICLSPSGNVIIAGTRNKTDQEGTESWLISLDANGKILWNKPFGNKSYNQASLVHFTADGNVMIAGWSGSSSDTSYRNSWMFKITPAGNGIWEKTFEGSEIKDFTVSSEGDIYTCGYQLDDSMRIKTYLLKINSDLKKLWSRQYLKKGCLNSTALNIKNELICSSGRWIWKVDKQGYILSEKNIGMADSVYSVSLLNNSIMYSGSRNNSPLVIKQTDTGLAAGEIVLPEYVSYKTVSCFPLPGKRLFLLLNSEVGVKVVVLDDKNHVSKSVNMSGCKIAGQGAVSITATGEIYLTLTAIDDPSFEDIAVVKLTF